MVQCPLLEDIVKESFWTIREEFDLLLKFQQKPASDFDILELCFLFDWI